MNSFTNAHSAQLIDFSEHTQLTYWSQKLDTKPESLKNGGPGLLQ
ncbi:hypothetical protein [Pedobacter sp. GR22-6]